VLVVILLFSPVRENIKYRAELTITDPDVQHQRGVRYEKLENDHEKAAKFYRLAAEQGHEMAQVHLAALLENGQGVPEGKEEVLLWRIKAAELGNITMQVNLGFYYWTGSDGVEKDFKEALRWTRMAAEQGNAIAQANLSGMYHTGGPGLERDAIMALAWEMLSEAGGNVNASTAYTKERMTADEVIEAEKRANELAQTIEANMGNN
jgi:TPR repeat protein